VLLEIFSGNQSIFGLGQNGVGSYYLATSTAIV